jgi:hypothetical protein
VAAGILRGALGSPGRACGLRGPALAAGRFGRASSRSRTRVASSRQRLPYGLDHLLARDRGGLLDEGVDARAERGVGGGEQVVGTRS